MNGERAWKKFRYIQKTSSNMLGVGQVELFFAAFMLNKKMREHAKGGSGTYVGRVVVDDVPFVGEGC